MKRNIALPEVKTHLRRTLIAGLVVLVPLAATLWVLVTIFGFLDAILGRALASVLGARIPGLGLLATAALVYAIGLFTSHVAGRRVIELWEAFASRVPLMGGIYRVTKEVSQAFGQRDRRPFRKVVAVEFPRKGIWTLGFLTAEVPKASPVPAGSLYVFIPTTPNPTSGWLILVPAGDVRATTYTIDEGMRVVVSAGIVDPARMAGVDAETTGPTPFTTGNLPLP